MGSLKQIALATAVILAAAPALAANVDVHMRNKGEAGAMVFEPALVQIAPGDTVTFIPTDKGHNAESIKDLIPKDAAPFKGKVNEQLVVTFDVAGAYAVKCLPHFAMGMVMAVVVGDAPANLDAIKAAKLPKPARTRLDAAFASAGL